jgi:hypothetical protein
MRPNRCSNLQGYPLTSLSLQRLNLITFVVRMLPMGATQASMLFYVTYLIVRCAKRIEQLAESTGIEPVTLP